MSLLDGDYDYDREQRNYEKYCERERRYEERRAEAKIRESEREEARAIRRDVKEFKKKCKLYERDSFLKRESRNPGRNAYIILQYCLQNCASNVEGCVGNLSCEFLPEAEAIRGYPIEIDYSQYKERQIQKIQKAMYGEYKQAVGFQKEMEKTFMELDKEYARRLKKSRSFFNRRKNLPVDLDGFYYAQVEHLCLSFDTSVMWKTKELKEEFYQRIQGMPLQEAITIAPQMYIDAIQQWLDRLKEYNTRPLPYKVELHQNSW